MARKKQGWASEMVDVVSLLPWWAGVALAVVSFALMRWIAGMEIPELADPRQIGTFSGRHLTRVLAIFGQIVFPVIFLVAAAISAIKSWRKSGAGSQFEFATKPTSRYSPKPEPEPDKYGMWKEVAVGEWTPSQIDTSRWSLELLNQLEWKRLEHVCAGYFQELGFRAEVAREGADGGVDIHLFSEGSSVPGIVVQCKAWKTYKVGIKQIRELFGVMAADRVREGIFVTTGTFTGEAKGFADGKNVHLIDGTDLVGKLRALEPDRQQALLRLATEGDYTTPTCPSCGIKMVQRKAKDGDEPFWGCPNFPRCKTTLNIAREQPPS